MLVASYNYYKNWLPVFEGQNNHPVSQERINSFETRLASSLKRNCFPVLALEYCTNCLKFKKILKLFKIFYLKHMKY